MDYNKKKLSVGIVAHVDAGKTTITEQFLFKAGIIKSIGRVDTGNTVTDAMELEKERGITIKTSTVSFDWNCTTINLLDTPGHMDFIAEVERSLSVLDGVVLAISAREGVQPQTKVLFNALKRMNIPVILFINKVDRMGVNLTKVYSDIEKYLTKDFFPLDILEDAGTREVTIKSFVTDEALTQNNYEKLSMHSDAFMEKYLEEQPENLRTDFDEHFLELIRNAKAYPLLHGVALHGIGMEPLLDAISSWFEMSHCSDLYARVYKVDHDEKGHRRCFTRLFGGELKLRETYPISGTEHHVKILNLSLLKGAKPIPVDAVSEGDIAIIYSDQLKIEDIIGSPTLIRDEFSISTPTLKATVEAPDLAIRKEILNALTILTDEDPFLGFSIHPDTEEIVVTLFGLVQKEILEATLKYRFDIDTVIKKPDIIYLETPSKESEALLRMYKDHFLPATVGLKIKPLPIGSGVRYITNVSFGDLKKPFQNAVEEGVLFGLKSGPQGNVVTDLEVSFVYSEFNSVDSTPSDYRKTAQLVVLNALKSAETILLEPILDYEVSAPIYAVGRVISDMIKMDGSVSTPEIEGEFSYLVGEVPARTSNLFATELADYTEGKGELSMRFNGKRRPLSPL
jgi:ribosomal protection tetracycline resistance protein